MAAIGAQSFFSVQTPPLSGLNLEPIQREGVDGIAFRDVGIQGEQGTITAIAHIASAADLDNALMAYYALKGTVVAVVDDNGDTWNNIVILNVRKISQSKFGSTAPSGIAARLVMQFTVQNASTSF